LNLGPTDYEKVPPEFHNFLSFSNLLILLILLL